MLRSIIVVLLGKRKNSALSFQRILTRWGCCVKTRLGIHDGVGAVCADRGLIILEVIAPKDATKKFLLELRRIPGATVKQVALGALKS